MMYYKNFKTIFFLFSKEFEFRGWFFYEYVLNKK